MEPLALFMTQFVWFFVVWSVVAYLVAWPWSLQLTRGFVSGSPHRCSAPACPESLARNLA